MVSKFSFGTIPASAPAMNTAASRANELERRLISFAAAILSLLSKLPRTPQGRHICGQILRSGTSAAANYGEARGAESSLLSAETIVGIIAENRELCRIIAASIKTARAATE